MPKFLLKNFQLSIALLAMFATTSIPLGVLQVGVWASMFENFYQETQSIFLSAERTFDGDYRCSGCELVSELGSATKEAIYQSNPSFENNLSYPLISQIVVSHPSFRGNILVQLDSCPKSFVSVETPPPQA
ncbi:MAG: hypothetical protein VXZ37_02280 [Verrucomicrobiota bacterium]|nr:hypothetical protein [Verrucomicrobiota bacterium]